MSKVEPNVKEALRRWQLAAKQKKQAEQAKQEAWREYMRLNSLAHQAEVDEVTERERYLELQMAQQEEQR